MMPGLPNVCASNAILSVKLSIFVQMTLLLWKTQPKVLYKEPTVSNCVFGMYFNRELFIWLLHCVPRQTNEANGNGMEQRCISMQQKHSLLAIIFPVVVA